MAKEIIQMKNPDNGNEQFPIAGTASTYDKDGNSVDTLMLNVNQRITDAISKIYPVGSIYISVEATSPASIYGGTWERVKDTFLLSAGDSYSAGSVGGRSIIRLAAAIGAVNSLTQSLGYFPNPITEFQRQHLSKRTMLGVKGDNLEVTGINHCTPVSEYDTADDNINIMPPYLTVFMWKRIA